MTILDQIVAAKRREVAALQDGTRPLPELPPGGRRVRDFTAALRRAGGTALIAEIKKASPSAGVIRPDFDPVRIAREYEAAGATALSVLTDEKFFQGQIGYLEQVSAAVKLPLLRKDFLIDEQQVLESIWADALLLIVAILGDEQLRRLHLLARSRGQAVLVEVHDERELERALAIGAEIIGINNRNLQDFTVDLAATERLAARIPAGKIIVAESGIESRADVARLARAGVKAILVGESLMRSGNIGGKVNELLERE